MLAKRKDSGQGSRLAIVFNGSPLFSGGAGSGESEIRRWIIEKDWLEAIIALPDQLFYNTGISTYIWIVTNRKSEERRGKVQLINAAGFFVKKRKSLGNKRNEIGDGEEGRPESDRGDRPSAWRLRARPALQDFRQCGLRLPPHHRGAAPAPELRAD